MPNESGVRLAVHPNGDGTTRIVVEGALTRAGNVERLRSAVAESRVNEDVREISIDLEAATAIDLQGVGVLLAMRGDSERRGIDLVIANPHGPVRLRLEQTGTLEYLRGRVPPGD